jgi:hypothetical protein
MENLDFENFHNSLIYFNKIIKDKCNKMHANPIDYKLQNSAEIKYLS